MAVCCVNVCACGGCEHMCECVSEGVCKIGCVYKGVNFPDLSQIEGNSRLLSQVYHCHAYDKGKTLVANGKQVDVGQ